MTDHASADECRTDNFVTLCFQVGKLAEKPQHPEARTQVHVRDARDVEKTQRKSQGAKRRVSSIVIHALHTLCVLGLSTCSVVQTLCAVLTSRKTFLVSVLTATLVLQRSPTVAPVGRREKDPEQNSERKGGTVIRYRISSTSE